jgi:hypothetical protein
MTSNNGSGLYLEPARSLFAVRVLDTQEPQSYVFSEV